MGQLISDSGHIIIGDHKIPIHNVTFSLNYSAEQSRDAAQKLHDEMAKLAAKLACKQCGKPEYKAGLCVKCFRRATSAPPVRVVGRIGRNWPCGCGSGKKFKKCCKA